jgi:AcrR family transcriptional regulator
MRKRSHGQATDRGARSRQSIVRAAVSVFSRHGYRGAALSAVASAAELTQPGLLHHFPSKEHLLMAVLAERDESDARLVTQAWGTSGRDFLSALQTLVEHNTTQRDLVRLFTVLVGEGVSAEHPANRYFVRRYAGIKDRMTARIHGSQESGEFATQVDPRVIATLLLAAMDGLQIQWLLDERTDMPAAFGVLIDMLAAYVTRPAP